MTAHMIQGQEDVVYGATRKGGEVPDGNYSGVQLLDLMEGGFLGSGSQIRPLHGHVMPEWILLKG